MAPTIGQTVQYQAQDDAVVNAAIVVGVNEDETVNLILFNDTSTTLVRLEDVYFYDNTVAGTAPAAEVARCYELDA